MKVELDPWASGIRIEDYNKVIKEFGIGHFSDMLKRISEPNLYMKRGIIYGHRDFKQIADAIRKKEKYVMMTGLMPSGKMHFGHKMVADEIIWFQNHGAKVYVAVADIEAYLMRGSSLEELRKVAIEEYLTNYIALGLKPKNCVFYFQSEGSVKYQTLSKIFAKKVTFNELKAIYGNLTPEKIISALTQVADILHPQLENPIPTVVPVGTDQDPHIRLTRDIAYRFKKEYNFILPSATYHKFMGGLGGGKMSSSEPKSYIALTDSHEEVKTKINKYAFSGGQPTVEEHRKKGGNPDIDVSYQFLTFVEEDDNKLRKIYSDYKSGALLTGELKAILIEKINKFLETHQKKREKAKDKIDKFIIED